MVFSPLVLLVYALQLALFGLVIWGLIDATIRPAPAFVAAGKLTKPIWLGILAVALVLCFFQLTSIFGILGIVVAVAAIVYLVDVRPAVREMRPGNGPYG